MKHLEQQHARSPGRTSGENKPREKPIALFFQEMQRGSAEDLARRLEARGIVVWRTEDSALPNATVLSGSLLDTIAEEISQVIIVADDWGPAFAGDQYLVSALCVWETMGVSLIGASVGSEMPAWPDELITSINTQGRRAWVDMRASDFGPLSVQLRNPIKSTESVAVQPATVKGQHFIEPETGIRFLWVPDGRFQMGHAGTRWAEPVHWIRVSSFWLGETPVTNAQYERFLRCNPEYPRPEYWNDERFTGDTRPVVGVSWEDAMAFCKWLSVHCSRLGVRFLLPSEAQWEFAARGVEGRLYPWGEPFPDSSRGVFGRRGETTAPVGSCPDGRGPFGHFDLFGNVWDWCLDVWSETAYRGRELDELNPVNTVGEEDAWRSVRGASWWSDSRWVAASRDWEWAIGRTDRHGFRVAAELLNDSDR